MVTSIKYLSIKLIRKTDEQLFISTTPCLRNFGEIVIDSSYVIVKTCPITSVDIMDAHYSKTRL